jgi:NAD-dependent deacetylase
VSQFASRRIYPVQDRLFTLPCTAVQFRLVGDTSLIQRLAPDVDRVTEALRKAHRVLVITGAGISAESDIPTFRGESGWWRSRNPRELATQSAFNENPRYVWEWYEYRRELVARSQPNAAHKMLAWLEQVGKDVFILTQNVDDLHERAGSHNVVHIHGSIWSVVCLKENRTYEERQVPLPKLPPTCTCGGLLRPAVVWFDEELPTEAVRQIEDYLQTGKVDVALVVGTQVTFDYIREWALFAKRTGALLVEVNPEETALTPLVDVSLRGKAGEILDFIRTKLLPDR